MSLSMVLWRSLFLCCCSASCPANGISGSSEIVRTDSSNLRFVPARRLSPFFSPLSCFKYRLQFIHSLQTVGSSIESVRAESPKSGEGKPADRLELHLSHALPIVYEVPPLPVNPCFTATTSNQPGLWPVSV